MRTVTLLLISLVATSHAATPFVGINYALNLQRKPLPIPTAASIVARAGFTKAKIFSHSIAYMNGLKNVGMKHLAVSIPNVELAGYNAAKANALVQKLTTFTDAGITCDVIVGNEPLASWYAGRYRNRIVPVFDLVKAAIAANAKADPSKIKITVAFQLGIIAKSYPPSQGSFTSGEREIIRQVASREATTGSPFFINIYPYFARAGNPKDISLDYALGNKGISKGGAIVRDYDSLLDAQVGAVRAALIALDPTFGPDKLPIVLGETGWPTAGVASADVSVANAKAFTQNTIKYVQTKGHVAGAYLFEAFDESLKSRDSGAGTDSKIENHWGLYYESGAPKFSFNLGTPATTTTKATTTTIKPRDTTTTTTSKLRGTTATTTTKARDTTRTTTRTTRATAAPDRKCLGPYPSAFPECEDRLKWLLANWDKPHYTDKGVDGSRCSIQRYLSTHEKWCPTVPAIAATEAPTTAGKVHAVTTAATDTTDSRSPSGKEIPSSTEGGPNPPTDKSPTSSPLKAATDAATGAASIVLSYLVILAQSCLLAVSMW